MQKRISLSYYAGLIDGEGSFSIQIQCRKYVKRGKENVKSGKECDLIVFSPRITMTLYYGNEVLKEMVKDFGGSVYKEKNRPATRWSLGTQDRCIAVTEALLPYLRIKKDIALRFLKAVKLIKANYRNYTPFMIKEVGHMALNLNEYKKVKYPKHLKKMLAVVAKRKAVTEKNDYLV